MNGHDLSPTSLEENAAIAHCIVIAADHSTFVYDSEIDNAQLIIATRKALRSNVSPTITRVVFAPLATLLQ